MTTGAVWGFRVLWALLPLVAGPAFADALAPTDPDFRTTVSLALWVLWVAVLAASLLPRPVTLTFVRITAPGAVAAALWAAFEAPDLGTAQIVATVAALLTAATALSPWLGQVFVDGASYGAERRFPLRAPAPVVVFAAPGAWAVAVGGLVTGPLLLADGTWLVGALTTAAGWAAAAVSIRALHHLSDRFLVFVPAGLVVHDRTAADEPVLLRKGQVAGLGPVASGTDISGALDLTKGAFGRPLEVRLSTPATFAVVVDRGRSTDQAAEHILVMPTLARAVVTEAADRGLVRMPAAPAS